MNDNEYEKELLSLLRECPDRKKATEVALSVVISLVAPPGSCQSPAVSSPPVVNGRD